MVATLVVVQLHPSVHLPIGSMLKLPTLGVIMDLGTMLQRIVLSLPMDIITTLLQLFRMLPITVGAFHLASP